MTTPIVKYQDVQKKTFAIPAGDIYSPVMTITHNLARTTTPGTNVILVHPSYVNVEVVSFDPFLLESVWFTTSRPMVADGTIYVQAHIGVALKDDISIDAVVTCDLIHSVNQ